jgi:hypothetical protein
MCYLKRNGNGTWGPNATLLRAATGAESFDTSPSAKWSAVYLNRPETVELLFSMVPNNDYYQPVFYYARLP